MSLRISSTATLALLLGACSSEEVQPQADEGAARIDCAIGAGAEFAPDCLVEDVEIDGERLLVVRHADGGVRRFRRFDDGRGLAVTDGADEARLTVDGDILEVEVAGDRYRFPARRTDNAAPQ